MLGHVHHLPPDGALGRKQSGWAPVGLLAVIAHLIREDTRIFIAANSKKGAELPPPLDLTPKQPKRRKTIEEIDAMVEGALRA